MLISRVQSFKRDEYCELRATIESDSLKDSFNLWYRIPIKFANFVDADRGDAFLAAGLLPAMKLGEPLDVSARVSQKLLRSARLIQSIYREWDPTLSEIPLTAPVRTPECQSPHRQLNVGMFVSLGVDSSYLLLKNVAACSAAQAFITHLLSVHGFDIYYGRGDATVFREMLTNAERVAKSLNKEVLPVVTNVREFGDQFVPWTRLYHGSAMASVGLALVRGFKTIFIAGGHQPRHLHPWGSHPLIDPLWSTENLRFLSEGCEIGRTEKVKYIAQFPVAMETLRVCASEPYSGYNCGRCEKCVRTMICLHIASALERCTTLPHQIDIDSVRSLPVSWIERAFIQDLLNNLSSNHFDLAIASALREAISRGTRADREREIESRVREIMTRRLEGVVALKDDAVLHQITRDSYHEDMLSPMTHDLESAGSSLQGNILDLGCAFGSFVRQCRSRDLDAIGVESSNDLVEVARLRNVGNYVLRAVGENLPFKEGAFSIVTCNDVLEHVQDPAKVLRESYRVLKRGGVLWLSFPDYSKALYEPNYRMFWIPFKSKRVAKLYVRLRGRRDSEYLNSIQFVTEQDVRNVLNAKMHDFRNQRLNDLREHIRAYCMERIRSTNKIETHSWRRLISSLKSLRIEDRTLCKICELYCLFGPFRSSFLAAKSTSVLVVEKQREAA